MNIPLVLSEDDLTVLARPAGHPAMPSLLEQFVSATSAAQRSGRMREAIEAIGFNWMAYGHARPSRDGLRTVHFFASHAHPQWTQRYFAEGWESCDFRLQGLQPGGLPRAWSEEDVEHHVAGRADASTREFAAHLRQCGVRGGLVFRFRGALREDQAAFLSLSSADAPSSDLENGEFLRRCLLVAHCIHAFYSDHARLGASAQGNQYVREQVLQALAQGKSNKEIASSLGLSIHSVEHHVKLLKRRFGASSRVGLAQATASSWS